MAYLDDATPQTVTKDDCAAQLRSEGFVYREPNDEWVRPGTRIKAKVRLNSQDGGFYIWRA